MIEFVADHRVLVGQQRFKESAVGVEARWIKDCLFGAKEFRERGFKLFVNVLRATNKTDARHAEAVRVEGRLSGSDQRRMIGETEIIICAHVEHTFVASDRNVRILGRRNYPLGFVKSLRFNFFECL